MSCHPVDVQADAPARQRRAKGPSGRGSLRKLMRRRSTVAFLMTLPLITLIVGLLAYPMSYAIYLSMLDRGMTKFIGLDNFALLIGYNRFWRVLYQTSLFTFAAVIFKAIIGFVVALLVHNTPAKGQRWWRGMLLMPWVIPPVMSVLAWRQLFDPSYSAFNWILDHLGIHGIFWLGDTGWARFSVIVVSVWFGAPFFMIMCLAWLKSVPEEIYEAASIDGANWWQRLRYVTLPMMRNAIAIVMLFSTIGGFTGFDIVYVLTSGGPLGTTSVLSTAAFFLSIMAGNFPLGASVSLFMLPILVVAATLILRGIAKQGNNA